MNTDMPAITKKIPANYYFLIVIIAIGSASQTHAQNVQTNTIRWTSNQAVDIKTSSTQSLPFEIETSVSTITVKQGEQVKNFTIDSKLGTWDDLKKDGVIEYQLNFGGKKGTGLIKRERNDLIFILDFSRYKDGIQQRFNISNYEVK